MTSVFAVSGLRSAVKRILEERGQLSVRRRETVPFGVDWTDDLGYYLGSGKHRFVDVGANEGQTVKRLLERFPEAEIHSFEPVPSTFEVLERSIAGTSVRAVNSALGATPGRETIYVSDASGLNSLHGSGEGIAIEVRTLDEYAAEAIDGRIDLLKIDTEGHEVPVLEGGSGLLGAGRVAHVVAECEFEASPYGPHGNFRSILDFLHPLGFRVVAFYCEGVDDLGWSWGDVLFRHVSPERLAAHGTNGYARSPFSGA
jgi:FkbM family methyltransferase